MENTKILFKIKDFGEMTAEIYPEYAPATAENFIALINDGFFDGLIFHRIIKGFMIQGGGYRPNGQEKHTKAISGEFAANGFMKNTLKHTRGVLSMARTSDPDSASSQFFIMHEDAPHLDSQYAAFGKLTDGFDVLDKIASVKTNFRDVPLAPVVIESVKVIG